jgi:hypothetical protein
MPAEARTLALAERFSKTPMEIEDAPAERWLRWLRVMGVEAEVRADAHGLGPDDPLTYEDDPEDD